MRLWGFMGEQLLLQFATLNTMNKQRTLLLAVLCACVLLALDQATKIWAVNALGDQHISLIGQALSLKLVFNPGAAFSFGSGFTWVFTLIAAAVCIGLPIYIARQCRRGECTRGALVALASIWAGACGNLIDRLFRDPGFGHGHVIDFISYGDFFVGNIADIELVVGVIAFIIIQMLAEQSEHSGYSGQSEQSLTEQSEHSSEPCSHRMESSGDCAGSAGLATPEQ